MTRFSTFIIAAVVSLSAADALTLKLAYQQSECIHQVCSLTCISLVACPMDRRVISRSTRRTLIRWRSVTQHAAIIFVARNRVTYPVVPSTRNLRTTTTCSLITINTHARGQRVRPHSFAPSS